MTVRSSMSCHCSRTLMTTSSRSLITRGTRTSRPTTKSQRDPVSGDGDDVGDVVADVVADGDRDGDMRAKTKTKTRQTIYSMRRRRCHQRRLPLYTCNLGVRRHRGHQRHPTAIPHSNKPSAVDFPPSTVSSDFAYLA